jgi:hypothetical protein
LSQQNTAVQAGFAESGRLVVSSPGVATKAPREERTETMFVHAVYFWLKDNLTEAQTGAFVAGARSLTTIKGVHHAYMGAPAETNRPVIERSYSYALVVVFASQRDHDLYQTDPIHDRFRDQCADLWRKVVIYDSVG